MSSFLAKLKSHDPDLRQEGILAVERLTAPVDPAILTALEDIISNRDISADNRDSAAKALGHIQDPAAHETLIRLTASPVPEMRSFGALGLGCWHSGEAVNVLVELLKDPVNSVRNQAERALLTIMDSVREHGIPLLLELLHHPVPLTRSPAARLLGLSEDLRAFKPLCRMLNSDEEWLGRMWAAKALGDLGTPEAADALADRLYHDEKNRVRAAAALALGELKPPGAREMLDRALEDSDAGVQKAVGEAIEQLGFAGDQPPQSQEEE